MSDIETSKNTHENLEKPQNSLNDLNEKSKKELLEWLKEEKIPLADIIKEVKEHGIVSYLYKEYPTDIDLAWVQTDVNELWFIHDNAQNKMKRGNVYYYLTFKKEWDWAHVCLNEVRRCSIPWLAHIKALKIDEFVEFIHEHSQN